MAPPSQELEPPANPERFKFKNPEALAAKRERKRIGGELFSHDRHVDLDIRYTGHPDHGARNLEDKVVLPLKIRFRDVGKGRAFYSDLAELRWSNQLQVRYVCRTKL